MKEQAKRIIENNCTALYVFIELLEKEETYMSVQCTDDEPTYTEVLNSLKMHILSSLDEVVE